jgi:hypothetical protein
VDWEEPSEIAAAPIQEIRVEPLDLSLFLELAVVADRLLKHLERKLFAPPHNRLERRGPPTASTASWVDCNPTCRRVFTRVSGLTEAENEELGRASVARRAREIEL